MGGVGGLGRSERKETSPMTEEDIWREFASLPPDARRQVADFIAFLRARLAPTRARRSSRRGRPFDKEPFFGMWRDREDMKDAARWVRETRKKEWRDSDE
jgi:hypothetical protein